MSRVITDLQDLRYLKWSKIRQSSGTAGSFLKAYDIVGGQKKYYKLSSYNPVDGINGHECINELIVDRLLTILAVDHLHYDLVHALIEVEGKEYTTWLCASMDFKQPGESKIPFDDFYDLNRKENESKLDFIARYGWNDYFYTMLVVDYLIINRDRHGANVEILKDAKNGTIRPAPLFDHGLSFVCRCETEQQLERFSPMQDVRVQSFIGSSSALKNLEIIPKDERPRLRPVEKRDRSLLFEGLHEALPKAYLEKIWDIIQERWCFYEDMQNQ